MEITCSNYFLHPIAEFLQELPRGSLCPVARFFYGRSFKPPIVGRKKKRPGWRLVARRVLPPQLRRWRRHNWRACAAHERVRSVTSTKCAMGVEKKVEACADRAHTPLAGCDDRDFFHMKAPVPVSTRASLSRALRTHRILSQPRAEKEAIVEKKRKKTAGAPRRARESVHSPTTSARRVP
jgi:hypothetical protein